MNQITAKVNSIEETDIVTYIRLRCGETEFSLIESKPPKWLSVGDEVYCTFQEPSVCISKDCPGKVSIENIIPGTLKSVRQNNSLCELTFESDVGKVVSLITQRAFDRLELVEGCDATMLIRSVDLSLEPVLTPIDLNAFQATLSRMKDA